MTFPSCRKTWRVHGPFSHWLFWGQLHAGRTIKIHLPSLAQKPKPHPFHARPSHTHTHTQKGRRERDTKTAPARENGRKSAGQIRNDTPMHKDDRWGRNKGIWRNKGGRDLTTTTTPAASLIAPRLNDRFVIFGTFSLWTPPQSCVDYFTD